MEARRLKIVLSLTHKICKIFRFLFPSIPAVGLLNLFYGGLLNLSKILMFPLENDDTDFTKNTGVNMDIGVLIRESNIGSNRYKSAIDKLPF